MERLERITVGHGIVPIMDWTKKNVTKFIVGCLEDEGYPMFKTRFAGRELPYVLGICWGGRGEFPDSVKFLNVPEKYREFLEEGYKDWMRLLKLWKETNIIKEYKEGELF